MFNVTWLLAQDNDVGGVVIVIPGVFGLLLLILFFAGAWKIFEKAGKPGWTVIVPIYDLIVLLEIVGKPAWWVILFFVPCVNVIVWLLVLIALARSYGKSELFGIGLWLLPIVFVPILGFGDAKYIGPARS